MYREVHEHSDTVFQLHCIIHTVGVNGTEEKQNWIENLK